MAKSVTLRRALLALFEQSDTLGNEIQNMGDIQMIDGEKCCGGCGCAKTSCCKKWLMVLLVLLIGIGAVVGLASTKPDDFRFERSTVIATSASKVFPHINAPAAFNEWSPWAKIDPNATTSYAGPKKGVGAAMSWDGNNEVGKGTMTLTEIESNKRVQYRMDFEKPMAGTSTAEFTLVPEGKGTKVTWAMYGKNNLMAKIFGLFIDCEKMMNEKFDEGLAALKQTSEAK